MEVYGELKNEIIEKLKQGVPTSVIIRDYNIPQSTVSTWLARLKENQVVPSPLTVTISAKNNAELINSAEINISTSISKVISPDTTDNEWIDVQKAISKELQNIVYRVEVKNTPKNAKPKIDNTAKIKEIAEKWDENPFIKKYELD